MTAHRSETDQGPDRRARREVIASIALGWPLSTALGLLCVYQVVAWIPSYLTWPFWPDLDVFATAARAWDAGIVPYRDLFGNNAPGTIYEFWILGHLFGWGRPATFLALDAGMLVSLGLLLGFWSRRCFGTRLPGLIAYATFLGYYLDLDYSQVAQRDWQGPFFAAASLLVLQASRGRVAVVLSGFSMAAAVAIRPQAVLFAPGVAVVLIDRARQEDGRVVPAGARRAILAWIAAAGAGVFLAVLPMIRSGNLGDFLGMLRLVAPGGRYHAWTIERFVDAFQGQFARFRLLAPPIGLLLLGPTRRRGDDPSPAWLVVFLFVLLYRPLSPQSHAYLSHPTALVSAILVGLLAARIRESPDIAATTRLLAIVLLMGLGLATQPRFSDARRSGMALAVLRDGIEPRARPAGYDAERKVLGSDPYSWEEYRDVLDYVRRLPEGLRVANALRAGPAITGPTGRLPAFPAESVVWLRVVRPEDEPAFVRTLRETPESVVIWDPSERSAPAPVRLDLLTPAIKELYEFDRRFGRIEAWRRRPGANRAEDRGLRLARGRS